MSSSSSRNPISSIKSPSSRTTAIIPSVSRVPRFMWSRTRPGVPAIIAAPCFSVRNWGTISIPPTSDATLSFRNFPRYSASAAVCWANSRVGASIRICGVRSPMASSCINGRRKANVFPEPVFALTIKSLFQSVDNTLS